MKNVLAERKLKFLDLSTGVQSNLVVRIGVPRWLEKEGYAVCSREYLGLFGAVADAIGIDELQALQLACDVDSMLVGLRDKYVFYWDNGDDYFSP